MVLLLYTKNSDALTPLRITTTETSTFDDVIRTTVTGTNTSNTGRKIIGAFDRDQIAKRRKGICFVSYYLPLLDKVTTLLPDTSSAGTTQNSTGTKNVYILFWIQIPILKTACGSDYFFTNFSLW